MRVLFFSMIAFSFLQSATAQSSESQLRSMEWLRGQWVAEFAGKSLSLDFTDAKGRTILSTFKQINSEDRMVFSRFMSIAQSENQVKLQLYPNLEKSKDHFVLRSSTDASTWVFDRVYADEDCQLPKGLVRKLEVTDIEKKCDRYPVKIVYTRVSTDQLQENLIGYRQQGNVRIKDDIERTYTRPQD